MYTRYIAAILLAAAVAFACSPPNHAAEANAAGREAAARHALSGAALVSSLDITVRREVAFALHVTNAGDKHMELSFPSGKTHEIVVLDSAGSEVWRWSADRMFTQAVQTRLVAPRETVTYEERWVPPSRPGRYTAVVTLLSANYPIEQRSEFALP